MTNPADARASTPWITLLTLASTATTLLFACAAPFEALAAIAATQMRRCDGVWLLLATWGVNQAVGFGLLHYPHTPKTFAWGLAIGMAAVGCALAARWIVDRTAARSEIARVVIAFGVAIIAFKLVILAWALVLGGAATTLSPTYFAQSLVRNSAILAGLYLAYRALIALGVPAADRGARTALA